MSKATITGTWNNQKLTKPLPPNAKGYNTDRLTWGTPPQGGEPNAYRFQGGPVEVPVDGTEFAVGTLTHSNRPTTANADFQVLLLSKLVRDGGGELSFVLGFEHQETPDLNGPMDDILSCLGGGDVGQPITIDGVPYRLRPTRLLKEGQDPTPTLVMAVGGPGVAASCPEGTDTSVRVMAVMCRSDKVDLRITTVNFRGQATGQGDEYIEIQNLGAAYVNLKGWTVNAGEAGQDFTFPDFTMMCGYRLRVYTNEIHPEWGGFSFGMKSSIWNDKGDTGSLRKPDGTVVVTYGYGDQATS
ncbi:choice-of-anchor K domain-containing protein [Nonomuraea sp. NPDC059023]|uniref:lamin tail domain-containing protein n=1 Tax=unclassified Nonomuraea TaxID=2593643 RepID=UPI0036A50611